MWFIIAVIFLAFLAVLKLYLSVTTGRYDLSRAQIHGKTVMVTGSSSGIGFETAMALAGAGARVIMACRTVSKAEDCRKFILSFYPNAEIHILQIDLANLQSVREAAREYISWKFPLHVLINNAGQAGKSKLELTADRLEETMAANHFGHFLLTNLLLEKLQASAPARIVNVSSTVHRTTSLDMSNLNFENIPFSGFHSYARTKLANVMFTRSLAQRLQNTGVTANALHPGVIASDIFRTVPAYFKVLFIYAAIPFMKDCVEGAQTQLYLACDPDVEHVSGQYFSDCKPATMNLQALDDEVCQQLWEASEKFTAM